MANDYFRARTGTTPNDLDLWPPVVITKEEIDAEIERLASLPVPANGRLRALIVHPRNKLSNGLAPGIQVALDVLKPGERTGSAGGRQVARLDVVLHGNRDAVERPTAAILRPYFLLASIAICMR